MYSIILCWIFFATKRQGGPWIMIWTNLIMLYLGMIQFHTNYSIHVQIFLQRSLFFLLVLKFNSPCVPAIPLGIINKQTWIHTALGCFHPIFRISWFLTSFFSIHFNVPYTVESEDFVGANFRGSLKSYKFVGT